MVDGACMSLMQSKAFRLVRPGTASVVQASGSDSAEEHFSVPPTDVCKHRHEIIEGCAVVCYDGDLNVFNQTEYIQRIPQQLPAIFTRLCARSSPVISTCAEFERHRNASKLTECLAAGSLADEALADQRAPALRQVFGNKTLQFITPRHPLVTRIYLLSPSPLFVTLDLYT